MGGRNGLSIFVADAFTKIPFKGNGAAVCLVPFGKVIPNDVKQNIAAEMNLSETAFISLKKQEDTFQNAKHFGLQWFTPTCEVTLCGHATLASAAVLFLACSNKSQFLEFDTLSGILKAKMLENNKIEIDLPAYEPKPVVQKEFEDVIKAAVGSTPVQEVVLSDTKKLLIRLRDDLTRENFLQLKPLEKDLLASSSDLKGVILTLKGSAENGCVDETGNPYDFISRYFAPWLGVFEDPVTGSAHSVLGPYWSKVLKKDKLYARQWSKRGGDLQVEVMPDRVIIAGDAVVVIRGEITF